jgi:hypothetical protein
MLKLTAPINVADTENTNIDLFGEALVLKI